MSITAINQKHPLVKITVPVNLSENQGDILKNYHFNEEPIRINAYFSPDAALHQQSITLTMSLIEKDLSVTDTEIFYGRILEENPSTQTASVYIFNSYDHILTQIYQQRFTKAPIYDQLGGQILTIKKDLCQIITMDDLVESYQKRYTHHTTPNNFTVAKNLQEYIANHQKQIHLAYRLGLFRSNEHIEIDTNTCIAFTDQTINLAPEENLTLQDFLQQKPDSLTVEEFTESILEDQGVETTIDEYLTQISNGPYKDYLKIKMINDFDEKIYFTIFPTDPYLSDFDEIVSEKWVKDIQEWLENVLAQLK